MEAGATVRMAFGGTAIDAVEEITRTEVPSRGPSREINFVSSGNGSSPAAWHLTSNVNALPSDRAAAEKKEGERPEHRPGLALGLVEGADFLPTQDPRVGADVVEDALRRP